MEQKLIQIGSSGGVTIPKNGLDMVGAKIGDIVETEFNAEAKAFTVKFKSESKPAVDPSVLQWTNEFILKNGELLKRLKDK